MKRKVMYDEEKDAINRSGVEMALGEYTRTGSNASQAARIAYGGGLRSLSV